MRDSVLCGHKNKLSNIILNSWRGSQDGAARNKTDSEPKINSWNPVLRRQEPDEKKHRLKERNEQTRGNEGG